MEEEDVNDIKLHHKKELLADYKLKKKEIKDRLNEFRGLNNEAYLKELIFCLLTPQSNAKKCWEAALLVEQLAKSGELSEELSEKRLAEILQKRTRFHNTKAKYVANAIKNWDMVKQRLNNNDVKQIREWLVDNINGFGLKEASHFLRNIGKSNNEIAILDRHILRNLKGMGIIGTDKIKSKKHYLELENKFIEFSRSVDISIDELDLLFWSRETGEVFK